jgi:hypothetical protein
MEAIDQRRNLGIVMAGVVPAIHVFSRSVH